MKKVLMVICLVLMLVLAACGGQDNDATTGGSEAEGDNNTVTNESSEATEDTTTSDVKVAYIAKNTVDAFHATLNNAAREKMNELVDAGTIADWQLYDGLTDPITQVNVLEDAINNGANFVILLPAESEGSAPILDRCAELDIPVVVVNSKTNNTDELAEAFVGSDDVQAGEMMANFVKEQIPEGGMYAHMMGIVGNSAQIDRGQGIENVLGQDSNWESAGDYAADWAADKAIQFASDVLTEYGDNIKAILCDNDDMSSAVQAYCNSVNREDIICIGVDGNAGPLQMVKDGTLKATVLQNGAAQAVTGIELIPDIIAGNDVEQNIMVPFTVVTSDNVDEFLK